MGDLTNKQIDQTYDGLIKTNDEQPIDGTLKTLQDGVGNDLPIQVSNTTVNFTGTVTGIPGGTDTTYDLGAVGAAGNINMALSGSDGSNDVVTMQAGTNITLTDIGSNTFTIDAAGGGGGGTEQILFPQRQMDDNGAQNIFNFNVPQQSNNYAGFQFNPITDYRVNRRFFMELWAREIRQAAVLVDEAAPFDVDMVFEIFDSHPETGMPRNLIATSQSAVTTNSGQWRWYRGIFDTPVTLDYGAYWGAWRSLSGTQTGAIYGSGTPNMPLMRAGQIDLVNPVGGPNDCVDFLSGMFTDDMSTSYALDFSFQWRIDTYPMTMIQY